MSLPRASCGCWAIRHIFGSNEFGQHKFESQSILFPVIGLHENAGHLDDCCEPFGIHGYSFCFHTSCSSIM